MLLEGVDLFGYDKLILDGLVAMAVSMDYMRATAHPFAGPREAPAPVAHINPDRLGIAAE